VAVCTVCKVEVGISSTSNVECSVGVPAGHVLLTEAACTVSNKHHVCDAAGAISPVGDCPEYSNMQVCELLTLCVPGMCASLHKITTAVCGQASVPVLCRHRVLVSEY
jgi:hypothetical protein